MEKIKKYLLKALKLERKIQKLKDKKHSDVFEFVMQGLIGVIVGAAWATLFGLSIALQSIPLLVATIFGGVGISMLAAFGVISNMAYSVDAVRYNRLDELEEDTIVLYENVKSKLLEAAKEEGIVNNKVTTRNVVIIVSEKLKEEENKSAELKEETNAKDETESVVESIEDENLVEEKPAKKPAKKAQKAEAVKKPTLLKKLTRKNKKVEEAEIENENNLEV